MKALFKSKPVLSLVTMVLLASTLAVSLFFVSSGRLSATGAANGEHVLHIFEHVTSTSATFIPVGTQKDARGSVFVFNDPVFDAADTHQIGHASGDCMLTSNTTFECGWTVILPKGQITIQGPSTTSGAPATLAITGGTGSYTEAKGWLYELTTKTAAGQDQQFEEFFHFEV